MSVSTYSVKGARLAVCKKSNQLSNLVYLLTLLLGGVYYPVSSLPVWLRYPAHALPFGYGIRALADATLYHRSIRSLAPQLLPLALFALVLPCAGVVAFRLLERLVRARASSTYIRRQATAITAYHPLPYNGPSVSTRRHRPSPCRWSPIVEPPGSTIV